MKLRALRYTLLLVALFSVSFLLWASLPSVPTATWVGAGDMSAARSGACTVVLSDGRPLIIAGADANGPTATADLFSTTGNWSAAASMNSKISHQSCAVLQDGRVLVAGGTTPGGGITTAAEIYDPSADSWAQAGIMNDARSGATVSVLQDGRVLIVGGQNSGGALNTLEIFDPNSGNFSNAGTMSSPRQDHAAAVLSDGRVLIVGGSSDGANALNTTEIYDPQAGSVSAGPAMSTPRARHTATTLLEGTVVVIGGSDYTNDLASAEFFDPAANNFNAASSLTTARSKHSAFLLPNNNEVLVVGGQSAGADLGSAELYVPWQKAFQATGAMATPRSDATGAALTAVDGRLLIAGGSSSSAELYGFATVKTDAADYPPGTTVTITGSGWQPGETVALTLVESPLIDTHGPFSAVADAFGNITNTSFVTDSHDVSIRFYLTATGSQSQAQNTFTDSTNVATLTTLNAISTPLVTGQPNVSFSGVVSLKTPTDPAIPAGGTVQLQQFLNAGCTGNPNATPGTATINASGNYSGTFTAPTVATTTTYHYQAQYQGDSQGSGGSATNWQKSVSACLAVTVNPTVATTTMVSSSQNPSTYGQSVTFTAAVSPNSGTTIPTGSVAFVIDGGAPVAGTVSTCPGAAPANSLCATYTTSALTVNGGTAHSVQANYTHTGNFVDSNGTLSGGQTVNKAALTITAGSYSGVYDGSSHALSDCSVSANFDNLTCTNSPAGPVGPDFGSGTVTPVVSGSTSNYSVTTNNGAWSITALGVSLTAGNYGPAAYDGSTHAPSACTSSAPSFVTCTNSPSPVGPDFGSGAVSPTPVYGKGIAADYSITPTNGSWSITALTVTVTGGGYSGVYDGNPHALSACASTYAGVSCTNNPVGPVGADVGGAAVAPVSAIATGIPADYDIKPVNGAWSITALGVSLTAGNYGPAAYDGSTHAPSACTSSAPSFVTCTNSPSPVGPDFGSGAVSPTPVYGKGIAADYSITPTNGSWSITALTVTVTGGGYSGVYDGNPHALSACASTYAGVSCTNNPVGPVGADVGGAAVAPVSAIATGIPADYDIKPVNGAWSITALGVSLTAGSYGPAAYDGSTHAPSACTSSAPSFVTCTNSPSPVGPDFGSGAVSPTPVYGKGIAADYSITPTNGSWSITALTVTVTGGGYSGVYDGNPHALSACASTYAGVSCTNNPVGPVGADVGGAAVAPVSAIATGIPADYDIKPVNGAWSITALGVSLTAGNYGPAAYDGSTHAPSACTSSAPSFVTCTNSPSPVGPDFGSGAVSPTPVYGKGIAADYSITPTNGAWSITALGVSLTAGSYGPAAYDGSTHAPSACTSSAPSFVTCTNSPSPVGPDFGSGAVSPTPVYGKGIAADYSITPTNGSWSITKATATVVVTPYNVIYDGQAHTATVTSITGVNGETGATVGAVTLNTTHTNPGTYSSDSWSFTGTGNYNNIAATTITDSIGYGACSAGPGDVILPPINLDGTSVYSRKGGSTIPVKFNVCGANGAPLTDPTLVFAPTGGALTMTGAMRGTITVVNEDSTNNIPDAAFTWDGQQWHFNMATMNLSSGYTYTFKINLAYAPASIQFVVGVK